MTKKIIVYLCIIFLISGCSIQNGNGENTVQTTKTTITTPVKKKIEYDEKKIGLAEGSTSNYQYYADEIEVNDENIDVLTLILTKLSEKRLQSEKSKNNENYIFEDEKFQYETYFFVSNEMYTGQFVVNFKGVSKVGFILYSYTPYKEKIGYYSTMGYGFSENIIPFGASDGESFEISRGDGDGSYYVNCTKNGQKLIEKNEE